jgi:hypothetical protein
MAAAEHFYSIGITGSLGGRDGRGPEHLER